MEKDSPPKFLSLHKCKQYSPLALVLVSLIHGHFFLAFYMIRARWYVFQVFSAWVSCVLCPKVSRANVGTRVVTNLAGCRREMNMYSTKIGWNTQM